MGFENMYDAPVVGGANNYTSQATQEAGMLEQSAQFISALPGAVASDLVNSSGAVIKFFGGDGWETDEHEMINKLDAFNVGAADYYDNHKGLVDGAELLATSLVPGALGIKALRAAQTGVAGSRILTSLGFDMVSPAALDSARALAGQKAVQSSSVWNAFTGELGKAIAIGVASNTLDAAAFGATAMVATNASPIYSGMTPLDMVKNWGEDSLIFGGVGGVFSAGKTMFTLKTAAAKADAAALKTSAIDTGSEFDHPMFRIAQTLISYSGATKAARAANEIVPSNVTSAVKTAITNFAHTAFPESDKAARATITGFVQKFMENPKNGLPLEVEAANFFAKLRDIRRIGAGELKGNELPFDATSGAIYTHTGDAPTHLGDLLGANGSLKLGKNFEVKIDYGTGKDTAIVDGSGANLDDATAMHAAWWRASVVRNLPDEIEVSSNNIPMAERAIEEAQLMKVAGAEHKFTFLDDQGNNLELDEAINNIRQVKLGVAKNLLDMGKTPEDVATLLNVSTKFLDNPGSTEFSLRSLTGKVAGVERLQEFLENPRVLVARYDLGTSVQTYASGAKVGQQHTVTNVFSDRGTLRATEQGVENAFNAALQGRYFKERLVTSPVTKPFSGTRLDFTPDYKYAEFNTVQEALDYAKATSNTSVDKAIIDKIKANLSDKLEYRIYNTTDDFETEKMHGIMKTSRGLHSYTSSTGESIIRLNGRDGIGLNAQTLTHEALHNVTVAKYYAVTYGRVTGASMQQHVSELIGLTKHVKSLFDAMDKSNLPAAEIGRIDAAFKDPSELITYGFTNSAVQDILRNMPGVSNKNAWSEFVDIVRKFMGLDPSHTSALADLIDITDRIIATPIEYTKGVQASKATVTRVAAQEAHYAANTELYQQQAKAYIDNVAEANRVTRELASNSILPELEGIQVKEQDILDRLDQASRTISAQGLIKSADNDPGSLGSLLQKVGSNVKRSVDEAKRKVQEIMGNAAHQLANDTALGNEWQLLQTKLRSSPGTYVLDPTGAPQLIRQDIAINQARAERAFALGKSDFQRATELEGDAQITVTQKLLDEVLTPHTVINNKRLANRVILDNTMMPGSSGHPAIQEGLSPVYHIPVDTARYSHFYFITEKSRLVGNGSTPSMVIAKDAQALASKRAAIESEFPGRFDFHTKGNTADYYKALGEYKYSRGMNESYVDSALRRSGKLADITPVLNKQGNLEAAEDFLGYHQRSAVREVRDATELRFANVFQRLDFLGKQYDDVALSKFAPEKAALMQMTGDIKNPYRDAINMAIDRGNARDFPRWQEMNAFLERTGDSAFGAVRSGWNSLINSSLTGEKLEAEVVRLNKLAEGVGLEPLYTKMAVAQFKDQLATRPVLRKFIAKTQATLNGLMLGLDPIQAINNGLGQVMFAAEFRSLISMIKAGDKGAGALAGLTKVQIPELPYSIDSAIKLHANASRAFLLGDTIFNPVTGKFEQVTRDALRKEYTDHGLLTSISQQYHQQLDDLTLSAKTLTDSELNARWERILSRGRTLTGNRLAEEYTRFVSAHAARKLTDAAMAAGLINSKAVASVYWNTAVNRIHGVNIASQRAVAFQGVIGQSIGMFMTYQHNLMQQLFRYAATGNTPAMAALASSQFGLYGIQGLPAFNAVATHLIGNAAGNTEHTDPYTWLAKNAAFQTPGNSTAAEWILYGGGSNVLGLIHPDLKMNIYSRGDINPRQLTVFPTSVTQTVAYTSVIGAMRNVLGTVGNVANGAPVIASILHGIEHNGINRPLSGLGVVLSGAQTTQGGQNIGSVDTNNTGGFWDKWTIANFVRIAGAKPLDDAAAADSMYRVAAYQAKTTSDIKGLAESMRIGQMNGGIPTPEEMEKFMQEYAKRGGNIKNFRGFVANTYKTANNNQVIALAQKLNNPHSKQVQAILGATNDREWIKLMNAGQSEGLQ